MWTVKVRDREIVTERERGVRKKERDKERDPERE